MAKSIFDPHHDGPALSGLDTFLGEPGESFSSMPEEMVDGKVEEDADEETPSAVHCDTGEPGDAVNEIATAAKALDESLHAEPVKPKTTLPNDGPG